MLSAIDDLRRAFAHPVPPTDPAVARAAATLVSRSQDTLGFFRQHRLDPMRQASEVLAQHGMSLDHEQLRSLMQHFKDLEEMNTARRRFLVQSLVSLVVLSCCVGAILSGRLTETQEKAVFGFIGVVVGFWLK